VAAVHQLAAIGEILQLNRLDSVQRVLRPSGCDRRPARFDRDRGGSRRLGAFICGRGKLEGIHTSHGWRGKAGEVSHLGRNIQRFGVSSFATLSATEVEDPSATPEILRSKGWNQLSNPSVKSPVARFALSIFVGSGKDRGWVVSSPINVGERWLGVIARKSDEPSLGTGHEVCS
jgi:hypothetical protein